MKLLTYQLKKFIMQVQRFLESNNSIQFAFGKLAGRGLVRSAPPAASTQRQNQSSWVRRQEEVHTRIEEAGLIEPGSAKDDGKEYQ
ncbi:hypothetical protein KY285_001849 [Solanum tuberosum]|nr:hypothetical protein KY289_002123 [Solanum tuberosum]KAH0765978.1 hypothetical protein KY285_001849 [Solanum tuberosum]